MPDNPVRFESGVFDWNAGRGYQPPSPRPGGQPPEAVDMEVAPTWSPFNSTAEIDTSQLDIRPGRVIEVAGPNPDRMTAREFLSRQADHQPEQPPETPDYLRGLHDMLLAVGGNQETGGMLPPEERVNLVNNTAEYCGHNITLSPESSAAIRQILAWEVCRALEGEQQRVLTAANLLNTGVPAAGDSDGANVREVPGTESPVGQPQEGGER